NASYPLISYLLTHVKRSWISVSGSESQTVEVQSGEDVTLMCSGLDKIVRVRYWLKLVKGTDIQCVSTMTSHNSTVTYRDRFSNHKFTMSSNTSTIFLKMKQVDFSHSGLYLCGFSSEGNSVIVSATYFKVQEAFIGRDSYLNMILGALVVFLSAVIFTLVVLIRKPQTGCNVASEDVTYAALSFHSQAKSRRRPAAENELETHVLYSTTR
uniref:Uncharacterized LOC110005886 n=1 Tax=Labrus bergylta TaxID=56723 RepID=A0A3Q3MIP5_9LABR